VKQEKKMGPGKKILFLALIFFTLLCFSPHIFSQDTKRDKGIIKDSALTVFIDCQWCKLDEIQKDISFIKLVEEQDKAQVYVLITKRDTESGGTEFILSFKGQKEFGGDNDQLKCQPDIGKEEKELLRELINTLKMGFMRYVGKTPISSLISIRLMDEVKPTSVEDKWDFWVFSISGDTFFNGQKLYKSGMLYGFFSANRVTPELKVRLSVGGMYNQDKFTFDDQIIKSSSNSQNFTGLIVKSLNDHWSVGGHFSALASTYTNTKFSLSPGPAIEYNLFPYSQSTRRQLRFLYRLDFKSIWYQEETIYEKTHENLLKESLSATLELKQKWGTISTSIEGSNYFHDFSKNRVYLRGELSLRIIGGLNINLNGSYSRIHDQLSLARSDATFEEILLRRKEIATTYNYYFSVGLSYTFGSTKSKVVNPRFGTGSQGISIMF
jgi:hypothetical protein